MDELLRAHAEACAAPHRPQVAQHERSMTCASDSALDEGRKGAPEGPSSGATHAIIWRHGQGRSDSEWERDDGPTRDGRPRGRTRPSGALDEAGVKRTKLTL